MDEIVDMQRSNLSQNYTPYDGLEFDSEQDAYDFYNRYAGSFGFSIRKEYRNINKKTGELTSRKFVCSKEGTRGPDKRDCVVKKHRAETREDCQAHMSIKLDRKTGKFVVYSFEPRHSHLVHIEQCAHMMPSQRKMCKAQQTQADLAEGVGIKLKSSYELMGKHVGGRSNLGFTHLDQKNYLRTRRQYDMAYGEAGALLGYFQQQVLENPSFYVAVQLDCEEKITNIFWTDAKMIIDYAHFGDVVSFDTTFRTNKECRPLAIFSGFNHHKETTIFGAALLYDETAASFEWLFEQLLTAMSGKQPKTIFTDQDSGMAKAIPNVMPETYHRICTWHMMQNAFRHLSFLFKKGCEFEKQFYSLINDVEDKEEFHLLWETMLDRYNLRGNEWMTSIFKLKEKWAKPFVKSSFSAGRKTTQLSESLNSDLRHYLKSDLALVQFFKHFERFVEDKRYKELEAEYNLRQKLPRRKMNTPMLNQASEVYTSKIFEEFQIEYEVYQGSYVKERTEINPEQEYVVAHYSESKVSKVTINSATQSLSCSCQKFEAVGILCSHALKVLDLMDIKVIPEKYILKRWTKNALAGSVEDCKGRNVEVDCRLKVASRYRMLCPNLVRLASRAAESDEASQLVAHYIDELNRKVEDILKRLRDDGMTMNEVPMKSVANETVGSDNPLENHDLARAKGIKKKNNPWKRNKRVRSWNENLPKKKKQSSKITLKDVHLTGSTTSTCVGATPIFSQRSYDPIPFVNYPSQNTSIDTLESARWVNSEEATFMKNPRYFQFMQECVNENPHREVLKDLN